MVPNMTHLLLKQHSSFNSAYYICLDACHQNLWSTKNSSTDLYCQKPGTIEFHYLTLNDKVKRWYSNSEGDSSLVAKRKMVA